MFISCKDCVQHSLCCSVWVQIGFEDESWRIRYSAGTNFIHWCTFICWIHFFSEWCTGSDKRRTVHSGLIVCFFHILHHLLYRFAWGHIGLQHTGSLYWCRLHPSESFHMPFFAVLQVLEETKRQSYPYLVMA